MTSDQTAGIGPGSSTGQATSRQLGATDAVVVGLSSMLGAGVFAAFGPAAAAAGPLLLAALGVAALVAYANATSSAQLAAQYPHSGGTYVYAGAQLGPRWGFMAGWAFVVGKTASCAAMALTFATYLVPDSPVAQRALSVAALAALTAINCRGITRTARVARLLLVVTLIVLVLAVVVILQTPGLSFGRLAGVEPVGAGTSAYGVLQGAGLLFFAFAGYARIATLGDEVANPERTIPRAILIALGSTFAIYLTVGATLLAALGPHALAATDAALRDAAAGVTAWAGPVIVIGASAASLGALLALLAGVSRITLTMARSRDLPHPFGAVGPTGVPVRAQLAVGCAAAVLSATVGDLTVMIAVSGFGVLLYYGLANASAFTQGRGHRRWPRALNIVGVLGCLTLATTLPPHGIALAGLMFVAGLGVREVIRRHSRREGRLTA